MPNTAVRAAAEGMPKVNHRTALAVTPINEEETMMTISPGFPQLRRLFGSFNRRDSATINEQARPVTIEVGSSIMNQHVNRRHLVTSTAALTASICGGSVVGVLAGEEPVGDLGVAEQLLQLAAQFRDAAKAIDPTITGAWLGQAVPVQSDEEGVLNSVYLERKHDPFVRKAAPPVPSQVAILEAAFHAEWKKLRALEPALNAAEQRYFDIKGRRPVMGEMTAEEVERIRRTAVADLAELPPSRASVEHTEAMRAYNKADAAARRKTGYGRLDREYSKQTHRTGNAANALLRYPAKTLADLAAKERVHRTWEFDGQDFNCIMDDIARLASKTI